jgi:hypothetical protein
MTMKERLAEEIENAFDEGNTGWLRSLAVDLLSCIEDHDFPRIVAHDPVTWGWLLFPYQFEMSVSEAMKNVTPDMIPFDSLEQCVRREAVQSLRHDTGFDISVDRCEFTHPVIWGNIVSIEIKGTKDRNRLSSA